MSDKEFAKEALRRAEALNKRYTARKRRVAAGCAAVVSFAVIVGLTLLLPAPNAEPAAPTFVYAASVFANGEVGGYVIVGVSGFVLGVAAVLVCRRFGGRD